MIKPQKYTGTSAIFRLLRNYRVFFPQKLYVTCKFVFQGDFKSQKEAVWVITNLTTGGTIEQMVMLVQSGALGPFCNMLLNKDWKTVMVVLDGIQNILSNAQKIGEADRVATMIEVCGGLDKLEALQQHSNEKIYQKALAIIDAFFSSEVSSA